MTPLRPTRTLLLIAASSLALAGCKIDNRPLLARGYAQPPAAALPEPGPLDAAAGRYDLIPAGQVAAPARAYPYAERAYALDRTFYDVPPDYGFQYGDEEPWVWQTADDYYVFAEPYDDDYAFYYYEPGYDYPYFVRDADYGYAYGPDGALIALFSAAGALIAANDYGAYYPQAHRFWSRGSDMFRDFGHASRMQVNPTIWSQRAPEIARQRQTWINAAQAQPQWRQWRSSGQGRQIAQRFDQVRPARMGGAQTLAFAQAPQGRFMPSQRGERGGRFAQVAPAQPGGGRFGSFTAPGAREAALAQGQRFEHGRMGREQRLAQPQVQTQAQVEARNPAQRGFERRGGQERFARQGPPAFAPSAQEHGRSAAFRAPPPNFAERARGGGREFRGGGQPHVAQPAPQAQAAPQFRGGGHGFRGDGGQPHVAQAAPQPQPQFHGGGQPQQHQAPPQQQQAHGGGGQQHGNGGNNGHDHKH